MPPYRYETPPFPSPDHPLALLAFSERLGGVSRHSASPRPADVVVVGEKKSEVVGAIRLPIFNFDCMPVFVGMS